MNSIDLLKIDLLPPICRCTLISLWLFYNVVVTIFTKAFNCVNICSLLYKLEKIGITDASLEWLMNYFISRLQSSVITQDSHLGQLLFLLYICDIASVFESCIFLMYVDDLKVFQTVESRDVFAELQRDLQTLFIGCHKWPWG